MPRTVVPVRAEPKGGVGRHARCGAVELRPNVISQGVRRLGQHRALPSARQSFYCTPPLPSVGVSIWMERG